MIYSQLDRPARRFAPAGTRFINTYQEQVKKGKLSLIKTGETNVYERIQADAESCKIENILHAAAMGDLNALKQREATYTDATTMPQNLMDAQNLVIKLKDEFYKMPIEVRKEFGNSPEAYVEEMGTPEFFKKMSPYNDKIAAIEKEKSAAEYDAKVKATASFNADVEKAMKGGKVNEQE